MLTEKARKERMWGWIPTLGELLSGKPIPDRYFGSSSVSDNIFDELQRLLKLSILVRENIAEITEALRAEGVHRERLKHDLRQLRKAYKWAITVFQDSTKEIDKSIGTAETGGPVKELAIRLAWYIDKHGMMSDSDMLKLFRYVNFPNADGKATALLKLAAQIRSEAEGISSEKDC